MPLRLRNLSLAGGQGILSARGSHLRSGHAVAIARVLKSVVHALWIKSAHTQAVETHFWSLWSLVTRSNIYAVTQHIAHNVTTRSLRREGVFRPFKGQDFEVNRDYAVPACPSLFVYHPRPTATTCHSTMASIDDTTRSLTHSQIQQHPLCLICEIFAILTLLLAAIFVTSNRAEGGLSPQTMSFLLLL